VSRPRVLPGTAVWGTCTAERAQHKAQRTHTPTTIPRLNTKVYSNTSMKSKCSISLNRNKMKRFKRLSLNVGMNVLLLSISMLDRSNDDIYIYIYTNVLDQFSSMSHSESKSCNSWIATRAAS
jgi:hypothetical protein